MRKTTLFFATALTVLLGACSDNDAVKPDHQNGVAVSFTASAQENNEEENNQTRSIVREGEDAPKVYTIEGSEETLYLLERTEEGIDYPTAQLDSTRGTVVVSTLDNDFSAIGYKGATATSISTTPWFHNERADMAGALYNYIPWDASNPFANFYGVYPYADGTNGITLSGASYAGVPYLDYVNPTDAMQQVDLLTACTPNIEYTTRTLPLASRVAPAVNLHFRHALTAIKFRMGNLPATTTITKVVFKNAASTGRYFMGTDAAGTGANWSTVGTPTDFTLDLTSSPVTVAGKVAGGYILGDNDGYTFFMIPQQLSGNNVQVEITLNNSTTITATLTGFWREGYTRVYTLSQDQTDWVYTISANSTYAVSAHYMATAAGPYYVQSYREDVATGDKQAVAWKVVGYQESEDAGQTWTTASTTKPSWLADLSKYSAMGSVNSNDTVHSTVIPDITDSLAIYNNVLKNAAQRGTAASPWNLSNSTGADAVQNTANSYLISAPGYYRIPLVYGNAIKNGAANTVAYRTNVTGVSILYNFYDHAAKQIDHPYIYYSNNGANIPDGAKLVWADRKGLVQDVALSSNGRFIQFYVSQENIQNGNAVIAVTQNGTVLWSWHLWFTQADALTQIPVTNYQSRTYNFSKNQLGYAYRQWTTSNYSEQRVARVLLEQTVSNNGVAQQTYFDIRQSPGSDYVLSSTKYQWGRKDPFPGVEQVEEGSFVIDGGNNKSWENITQHPEIFYSDGSTWGSNGVIFYNMWDNAATTYGYNDNNVIKTVYDPSPVGFKMPPSNAFTGFSTTGADDYGIKTNIRGRTKDYGIDFYTTNSRTVTIFFPFTGYRRCANGTLYGISGFHHGSTTWSAAIMNDIAGSINMSSAACLHYGSEIIRFQPATSTAYGLSVHPIAE